MMIVVVVEVFFHVTHVFVCYYVSIHTFVLEMLTVKSYSTTMHTEALKSKMLFFVPLSAYKAHTQPLHPEKGTTLEMFLLHLWNA